MFRAARRVGVDVPQLPRAAAHRPRLRSERPPDLPVARRRSATDEQAPHGSQFEERLRAIPGVQSVTASFPFPLAGDFSTIRWGLEDALTDNTKYQAVDWQVVRPGYFETMRTALVTGRTFTEADNDPKRNVVVVDTMLAAKAFPNESAVGKRILIRIRTPEPEWVEIIGVVGHQRVTSLADPGREQVYFADGFLGFGGANGGPCAPAAIPRSSRERFAPRSPRSIRSTWSTELQPMDALVQQAQASTRFSLMLIGVFAVMAALLVALDCTACCRRSCAAHRRNRRAHGGWGAPGQILRLVVGHGLRLSAAGWSWASSPRSP